MASVGARLIEYFHLCSITDPARGIMSDNASELESVFTQNEIEQYFRRVGSKILAGETVISAMGE